MVPDIITNIYFQITNLQERLGRNMRRSMILSSDTAYECPGQLPIFAKTPSFHLGNTGELLRRALPQMGGQPMLVVPCLSLAI